MSKISNGQTDDRGLRGVLPSTFTRPNPEPFAIPVIRPWRIVKNSIALLAGQLLVQTSSYALGLSIARVFGQAAYGKYSLAFGFVGMFSFLFTMGLNQIVVREVARVPLKARSTLIAALLPQLASFPVVFLLIKLAARLVGYPRDTQWFITMATCITMANTMVDLPISVFQGLQRMELDTLLRSVGNVGTLVLVWLVLVSSRDLRAVLLAELLGSIVGVICGWSIVVHLTRHSGGFQVRNSLLLLSNALPLGIGWGVVALYQRVPIVILSMFRSEHEVGLYTAAYNVVAPFTLLPLAFVGSLLPALSTLFRTDCLSLIKFHNRLLIYTLMAGLPLTVSLILFSSDIVRLVYGQQFELAVEALQILGPTITLSFLSTYLSNVLIAIDRQKFLLIVILAILATTICTNLLLVPPSGFRGAAIARVATESGGLILLLYFTSRALNINQQDMPLH